MTWLPMWLRNWLYVKHGICAATGLHRIPWNGRCLDCGKSREELPSDGNVW